MGCAYYHAQPSQCGNAAVVAVTRRAGLPGSGRLWFPVCESHFFAKMNPEWAVHSLRGHS
jgi:hypothetical protein